MNPRSFLTIAALGIAMLLSPASRAADAASRPLRIVLIGDSTVCSYPATRPDRGWGQFIEERFRDGAVKVINLAAAGRSTKTFLGEGRWKKALEEKPDYVLIQFGHNDSHAPENPESTDAATDYKEYLRRYIDESRAVGATPLLVTPMVRRTFDADGKLRDNLQRYADAMKEVGAEKKALVIDLHAASKALVERLGPEASAEMANEKGDVTHFNEKGARAMAGLVMEELPTAEPKLKPVMAGEDKVIDATKAGVIGDGATLNTVPIQKVIDDCAAAGGGTISFPPGRYLTGTIQIKSNVTLRLEKDAMLLGSTDAADYRNLDPFIDGSGNPMGHALIVAIDADHVGIEGRGTVDGQNAKLQARQKPYTLRPFLLRWVRCTNVTVRDVHLTNPGAWTLNFFEARGVLIEGVTIRAREPRLRNTDGINLDSSQNVRVRRCDVVSGDDALVIKSTGAKPSRDIVVSDCTLSTRTNAIKLGTESFGGFENISISNCRISNTKMAGIALYAVDGGDLRSVTIRDIEMDGVIVPISIRLGARLKTFRAGDRPRPMPGKLRDVTIKNVNAKNVGLIGLLVNGVPGHPVEALTLENIEIKLPGGGTAEAAKVQLPEKESNYPEFDTFGKILPAYGIYARHVRGLKLQNVRTTLLQPDARPATVFIDVEAVTPADFARESSNLE